MGRNRLLLAGLLAFALATVTAAAPAAAFAGYPIATAVATVEAGHGDQQHRPGSDDPDDPDDSDDPDDPGNGRKGGMTCCFF